MRDITFFQAGADKCDLSDKSKTGEDKTNLRRKTRLQ